MRESYGSRIYKRPEKRKTPIVPIVLAIAILAGGYYFFHGLEKPKPEPRQSGGPAPVEMESKQEKKIPDTGSENPPDPRSEVSSRPAKETASLALNPPGRMPDLSVERERAQKLFKEGKYKDALDVFLEISREDITAYTSVGKCCFLLEDYQMARQYLENAIANDSGDFDALKFMAFTSYRQDELEESLGHAEEAYRINDKDSELKGLLDRLNREIAVMEDGYKDVHIPKFKLQFSRADHQDARDLVLGILKKAYRKIGQELNYYPDQDITVILYNEQTFFDVTRSPGWAGGLFDGKIRMPIQGYKGHEDELERVLFHEYTHALVHFLANRCPLWLNEGLAEYFSLEDKEKIGQILPLQLLERRFPSDANVVMVAYLESYSVVSDMVDKFGMYRIKELLEAQKDLQDIRKAFDKVLYTSYDRFIENWGRD